MMGAIYKQTRKVHDREWFAREKIGYAAPKPRGVPLSKVYTVVHPPVTAANVAERFNLLADRWLAETQNVSSVTQVVLHPAYQQIIGLGPAALPFIVARLLSAPHHWFWALTAITGENPVQQDDLGNVERMRHRWMDWARLHGYLRD